MDPSTALHDAAQQVIAAANSSLTAVLNGFIAKFVGWPFTAAPGFLVDGAGRTEGFARVVHTTPTIQEARDAGGFPADGVAAVIDATDHLDLDKLRAVTAV